MPKVVLNAIGSRYGSVDGLNANFDRIEEEFENSLSRDGSAPNAMLADLDMNGRHILNVASINASSLSVGDVPVTAVPLTLLALGYNSYEFTATAGQTVLNFVDEFGVLDRVNVFVNGLALSTLDYVVVVNTIVMATPLTVGDEVKVDVVGTGAGTSSGSTNVVAFSSLTYVATASQTNFDTGSANLNTNRVEVHVDGLKVAQNTLTVSGSFVILLPQTVGAIVDITLYTAGIVSGSPAPSAPSSGPATLPLVVVTSTAAVNGASNTRYSFTATSAASTILLPPVPAAGDVVEIYNDTTRVDLIINRNSNRIKRLAENYILDLPSLKLVYVNATIGWSF